MCSKFTLYLVVTECSEIADFWVWEFGGRGSVVLEPGSLLPPPSYPFSFSNPGSGRKRDCQITAFALQHLKTCLRHQEVLGQSWHRPAQTTTTTLLRVLNPRFLSLLNQVSSQRHPGIESQLKPPGTIQALCSASQGVSPTQGYALARRPWLSSSSASALKPLPCNNSEGYFWQLFSSYLQYLWYLLSCPSLKEIREAGLLVHWGPLR